MRLQVRLRYQEGLFKRNYVDVRLELSEVEKRIVRKRGFGRSELDLSPGYLANSVPILPLWVGAPLMGLAPMLAQIAQDIIP
jgi:hypothetical protein